MLKNLSALFLSGVLWSAAAPVFGQDLTPPVIAFTAPSQAYISSLPGIAGTAFDDTVVSSVQVRVQRQSDGYYWDGSAFAAPGTWLEVPILSTTPVSWTYSTVPAWLNGAAYEVTARAMDSSDNWSVDYSTAVFHYDVGTPVSRVVSPVPGSIVSSFAAINGTAWDNESFIGQVWVKIDRADDNYYWNGALAQWTAAEVWNLAVGSFTWTYTGLAYGDLTAGTTYTAVSRAVDLAGNVEVSTDAAVSFLYAPVPLPPGCSMALSVRNDGLGDHTSIQDAVDALPKNLSGDVCVVIKPDGSYNGQVTVQGFTNNGYRVRIMAEPGGGPVTVSPQGGETAGFLLRNSSVTIENMEVIPAAVMPYGVLASSDNITLSGVTVVSAGSISSAGIRVSSFSSISNAAVVTENAAAIHLAGSSNTVAASGADNVSGTYPALLIDGGHYNSVTGSSLKNYEGPALGLSEGASYNTVSLSTVSTEGNGLAALQISTAPYNTVSDSWIYSLTGYGLRLDGGGWNTVLRTTMTSAGLANTALYLSASSFNRFEDSVVRHTGSGWAAYLTGGSHNNSLLRVLAITEAVNRSAFYLNASSSNTASGCVLSAPAGWAVYLSNGGFNNLVTASALYGGGIAYSTIYLNGVSSTTFSDNFLHNPAGKAVHVSLNARDTSIIRSTITTGAFFPAVQLEFSSGTTLADSYVHGGSSAVYVRGSTDTVISGSVLITTITAGKGLAVAQGSNGLIFSGGSAAGGAAAPAVHLAAGNSGAFSFSSLTVNGGRAGLKMDAQDPGASLALAGLIFQGLSPGATALDLPAATMVSTFTALSFSGEGIAVNVNGSALLPGSRVTMRDSLGSRYGTSYENDPGDYVDWVPDYIPPALSPAAFSGVGTGSLTMNWGSTFDPGTNYFVRLATHPASSPYVAMATTTALAYGFTGLTPDTTYYGFVSTDIASGYLASGEGLTLAAAPGPPAFAGVAYSSAALAWSAGGNPAWTVYEYEVYTSTDFVSFTSSGSLAATSDEFGGLEQGTTYFARVRAVNAAGVPTAYSYSGPVITARLYAAGAPAGVAGVTLGVSSIAWSWNSGTLADADHFVARDGGVVVSTQPFGATGSYIQEGLTPNTTHLLTVTGANANGESPAAASAVVYTLAAPPAALAAPFVGASSASLAWGLNGNPAGTAAQLWRSPDDASYANVYEGAALSYTDAALEECTLYYYKARNISGAGLYTAFTAPVSFTTAASTPAAPGGLYAEALDGARIALSWGHSPSVASVTQYRLYYDNAGGAINYGAPYAVFSSTVSSWTTPALTAGNTYKFAVRAVTRCGVEESNASAAYAQAVGVLSGVRAAIKVPQTGKRIKGNSVTIVAELTLGLPSQVKNVRFQYRLAGNAGWTDIAAANINHPNPDPAAPYFVHWDADAMAAGTYELRALATDVFDTADPAPPVITVAIDPVDFEVSESVSGGQMLKEQKIVNTVPSTVQAGDDSTALLTKVVIPAGAVNVATAAVTLIPNPPSRPAPPPGSGDLAIAVKINLSNGQSQLAGGNSAVITLSYRDDDGDGVVDGTTAEAGRLRIYAASDTGNSWTPLASTVDRTAKTVSAQTTHFSFFSAFATAASGLSSLKAYPNPWQPGAGGRFDAAAVTFTGLPNEARIKVFTILGELVRQLDVTAADAGTKTWDGRNSNGSKAASGIYLVRVESGGDDRTLKLAVER
ncbi:MAG: right-handed parallel beta-helix repeat-containing protein [Elusimicrobiota bacterium]